MGVGVKETNRASCGLGDLNGPGDLRDPGEPKNTAYETTRMRGRVQQKKKRIFDPARDRILASSATTIATVEFNVAEFARIPMTGPATAPIPDGGAALRIQ
jgi:hypothetical protein